MILALGLIVALLQPRPTNFFSPVNFTNIITQMAGTTLLAYGVVFVLLIGEIDLSIAYVSGVAGVVVAETAAADGPGPAVGLFVILVAALGPPIGVFQGSFVALIGVPSFVVTLAGYEIWQGVIPARSRQGVITIQGPHDQRLLELLLFATTSGWIMAIVVSVFYSGGVARNASRASGTASPCATRLCSRSSASPSRPWPS